MTNEIARLERRIEHLERQMDEVRTVLSTEFGNRDHKGNVPRALEAMSSKLSEVDVTLRGDRGDNGMQSHVRMLVREKKDRDRDRSQFKWLLVTAIATFAVSALLQVLGMVN